MCKDAQSFTELGLFNVYVYSSKVYKAIKIRRRDYALIIRIILFCIGLVVINMSHTTTFKSAHILNLNTSLHEFLARSMVFSVLATSRVYNFLDNIVHVIDGVNEGRVFCIRVISYTIYFLCVVEAHAHTNHFDTSSPGLFCLGYCLSCMKQKWQLYQVIISLVLFFAVKYLVIFSSTDQFSFYSVQAPVRSLHRKKATSLETSKPLRRKM